MPKAAFATSGLGIYPVVVTIFCCLLLLSNIGASKPIEWGPFLTDGGVFLFPLTYVLGDVLSEVYGIRATRRAILLGFLMAVLASVTFWLVKISHAPDWYDNQPFATALGPIPRIVLGSVTGYLLGEFLNSFVLVKIKERTKEKYLWARLAGSTIVGEFFDTLAFCLIAGPAIGIVTAGDLTKYTYQGFLYKCAVEFAMLPVTYQVIKWIKRREPSYGQALLALQQPPLVSASNSVPETRP